MNTSQGRDALVIGSDNKPPVLFKDEYELWVNRFICLSCGKKKGHFIWKSIEEGPTPIPTVMINGRAGLNSIIGFTEDEKRQHFAEIEAQHCLVQSLTNDVYRNLDIYQNSAKETWDQLEKIMLGFKVGNQLQVTAIMDRYENFKMRDVETLDEAYDRFVVLNNEMKKNNIPRTEFDQNVKFVNSLTPEWKPFAPFVK